MTQPMKIVVIEGSSKPPVFIVRLLEGLASRGHQVYIIHFNAKKKLSHDGIKFVSLGSHKNKTDLIFRSLRLGLKTGKIFAFRSLRLILKGNARVLQKHNLKLITTSIQPDIIHINWPSLLGFADEILDEGKFPVVLSQRGYQINIRPFVNEQNMRELRNAFPKLGGFHSVSQAISAQGDLIYWASEKIDKVIYTGLDLEKFKFTADFTKGKKLKLISIGRPHWKKAYYYSIQACVFLKEKQIDFEYEIIGAAGNEELLFLINNLGLEKEVKLSHKLEQERVYELIRTSHLLIVSSVEEGLPNVLVEAMALGTPVLSTRCGGVEELIEHERNGFLVPQRNPEVMAQEIEIFHKMPVEEIHKIIKSAREKVQSRHSLTQMLERMESLYLQVKENF